ncbi:hypothetical protein BST61_g2294 [Cercospora zeina]
MPLSTKQMEYLAIAWQCFESEPKIDFEKFKTVAGLASAASARELMRLTKKKLKEEYGALSGTMTAANGNTVGGATPSKKSTPRTPSSKRARGKKAVSEINGSAADGDGDDDEDDGEGTPVAKRSKTPAGVAKNSGKNFASGSSDAIIKHEPDVAGDDGDSDAYL